MKLKQMKGCQEVKPIAGNKVCWHGFIKAFCSTVEEQEMT